MGPTDVVLAPWRLTRGVVRAAEDLHDLAERARRDPDPVEQARERLDLALGELDTLIGVARSLEATAVALDSGGEDLLRATEELHATARTLVTGGDDLRRTGEKLDGHTVELIGGGRELTEVAKEMAESLRVFRSALPRLLGGLDTVEQLEDAVETVADTVEPLQGVARGVGRVSTRLSRSG